VTAPQFGTPVEPAPEPRRDRWGRPLVVPPDGGKEVAYTRCTTYVKALDDLNNLMDWKARMTLIGAAKSESIIKAAKVLDPSDKRGAKDLVEKALTLAGAGDKATDGTTLHRLTELMDTGRPLPDGLDDQTLADLAAYRRATAGLQVRSAEQFVVNHALKVAGTFDRELGMPTDRVPAWLAGKVVIGDLKTGSLEWAIGAICMQLAVYANSDRYDVEAGTTAPLEVDRSVGVVIHLPAGSGECALYAVNLAAGWEAVQLAGKVREWRAGAKLNKLAAAFEVTEVQAA
jgi:hypothetical protein